MIKDNCSVIGTCDLSHIFSDKNRKLLYSDISLQALLLSNLITIIWSQIAGWSAVMVMWSYWCHSVSIGILWLLKILCLKDFSTKGVEIPVGTELAPTTFAKIECALVFLVHYGFFHFAYAKGLQILYPAINPEAVIPIAIIFFLYQCFSFFYSRKWETKQKPNIGTVMLFPYIRIIPMHLSFIIGGYIVYLIGGTFSSRVILVIFMLLKTFADAFMHAAERRGFSD
jgi:hypothetical protein